jgi:hypothetical protein
LSFARLVRADWVAFAAALALLLVMSADWYSTAAGDEARRIERLADQEGAAGGETQDAETDARIAAENAEQTAWQADRTLDRVILGGLLATVLLGIGAAFLRAAGSRFKPPWTPSGILALAATATGLLLGVHVLVLAGDDAGTQIKWGAPVAAILLGLIALAAVTALRAEESGKAWRRLEREQKKAPVEGTA